MTARSLPASAKLITVHGTGAGDVSASGKRWWQHGSKFQKDLSERLDLDESRVDLEPFQWALGPNSETERRAAGGALLERLQELEAARTPYYLIGHSHGGSVIYHALLQSVRHKIELKHLRHWCTVGTPFINFVPKRFYPQRLTTLGLAVIASALVAIAASLLTLYIDETLGPGQRILDPVRADRGYFGWSWYDRTRVQFILALLATGTTAIVLAYFLEKKRRTWFSAAQKRAVEKHYGATWLGLWHIQDEAIGALKNVGGTSGRIIPNTVLYPLVPIAQIALVMLICVITIVQTYSSGLRADFLAGLRSMLPDFNYGLCANCAPPGFAQAAWSILLDGGAKYVSLLGLFAVFAAALWASTFILKMVFYAIGTPLAAALNLIIWQSVRQGAWGDDQLKEVVLSAAAHPPEFSHRFEPLPDLVAAPLNTHSDQHAISTLNKVRQVLGMVAESGSAGPDIRSELTESLQWNELIHTSYFDVPAFADLVSVALHRAGMAKRRDGVFSSDDDLAAMVAWLDRHTLRATPEPQSRSAELCGNSLRPGRDPCSPR